MQKLREKILVFRVSEGRDPRAFGELYDLYIERIHRFIYFKVSSKEEAEDLTSQVFLKVWEYLADSQGRRIQDFRAFMYQSARNVVVDFYRKQGRMGEKVELENIEEEAAIEDPRQAFLLNQLYKSDRAYLADCLRKLKDEFREVIILRYLEDMGIQEIAQIVDKSAGNIRVLLHRGIKALREVVEKEKIV
ncbi:MAG: RNA polymerase sigma factor [bacterium]|nr:RNA polymerase sigma factor [bacterium]